MNNSLYNNMNTSHTNNAYLPSDKVLSLINDNGNILFVLSRFGLPLGFGNKTVEEICTAQEVDMATFLAVANFVCGKGGGYDDHQVSLPSLMSYLKRAHSWFLDFNLPAIRRKLIEAIHYSEKDELAMLIMRFYDEYVSEVRAHMHHEDAKVFGYVEGLMEGYLNRDYSIAHFASKHNHIEAKLADLKGVIVRYYPQGGNAGDLLSSVLFDIINCENDLYSHCAVEDKLFVPAVARLEQQLRDKGGCCYDNNPTASNDEQTEQLSVREKEIVACVAKGMTSKEIADALCLSVHTVTTHRRNISAKLQIHSSAGLTIYAIIHQLVTLDQIKLQ